MKKHITEQETQRVIGRLAAVAHEGRVASGPGAVCMTRDRMIYLTLGEVQQIATNGRTVSALIRGIDTNNEFVLLLGRGDKAYATVVVAPKPLAVLHRQWHGTLEKERQK